MRVRGKNSTMHSGPRSASAAAAPAPPTVASRHANFALLHCLAQTPFAEYVPALAAAMHSGDGLPRTLSWTGVHTTHTYEDLARSVTSPAPSLVPALADLTTSHLLPVLAPHSRRDVGMKRRPRRRPRASNILNLTRDSTLDGSPSTPEAVLRATPSEYLYSCFECVKRLTGHQVPVYCILVSEASDQFVTGSDDGLIKIWSARTGYLERVLRGHDGDIIELVLVPGTDVMVSAANDSTVRLWCLRSGEALGTFPSCHTRGVNTIAVSPAPDRPWLVSGGQNSELRLWYATDPTSPPVVVPIPTPEHPAPPAASAALARARATAAVIPPQDSSLGFQGEGRGEGRIPVAPSSSTRPFGTGSQPPLPPPRSPRATPSAAASVAAGSHMNGGPAGLTPALPGALPGHGGAAANSVASGSVSVEILSVSFNAGGTRFAISGSDSSAHVYAVDLPPCHSDRVKAPSHAMPSVRHLASLRGHSDTVYLVAFARHGEMVATGCRDGTARIWRRTRGRVPVKRRGRMDGTGTWSSVVLDTRRAVKREAERPEGHRGRLQGGGGGGGDASTTNGSRARRPPWPGTVDALIWSLDDRRVVTSSSDCMLRVWDAETGSLLHSLEGHSREVYVLVVHPYDRRIVMSACYDCTCMMWDIETGVCVKSFRADIGADSRGGHVRSPSEGQASNAVPSAASPRHRDGASILDGCFSPDGSSFVLSDTYGSFCVYSMDNSESLLLAPEQQYFSNEHAPVVRDSAQNAVEEQTGTPLHLLPRATLCNADLAPYPCEQQHFSLQQLQAVLNSPSPSPVKHSPTRVSRRRGNRLSTRGVDPADVLMRPPSRVDGAGASVLADIGRPIAVVPREELISRATKYRAREQSNEKRLVRHARAHARRLAKNRLQAQLEKDLVIGDDVNDFLVSDSDKYDSDAEFEMGKDEMSDERSGEVAQDSLDGGDSQRKSPRKGSVQHPRRRMDRSADAFTSSSESSHSGDSYSSRSMSYDYDSYSESDDDSLSGWSSDSHSGRDGLDRLRTADVNGIAANGTFTPDMNACRVGSQSAKIRRKIRDDDDDDDDSADGNGFIEDTLQCAEPKGFSNLKNGDVGPDERRAQLAPSKGLDPVPAQSVGGRQTVSGARSVVRPFAGSIGGTQVVASSKAPRSQNGLQIHLPLDWASRGNIQYGLGSVAPARNPSFSSDQPNGHAILPEAGDHNVRSEALGDTASFVCSAFASTGAANDRGGRAGDIDTRSNTCRGNEVPKDNVVPSNAASTVKSKADAENSILSGSPARPARNQAERSRSRSGAALRRADGRPDISVDGGHERSGDDDALMRRELRRLEKRQTLRRKRRVASRSHRREFVDPIFKSDSTPRRKMRLSEGRSIRDGGEAAGIDGGAHLRRHRGRLKKRKRRRHDGGPPDFGGGLVPDTKDTSDGRLRNRRKRSRSLYEDGTGNINADASKKRRRRTRSSKERAAERERTSRGVKEDRSAEKGSFEVPEGDPSHGTAAVGAASLKLKVPFPLEASKWLRVTSTRYTYVPQICDLVTYFPHGHRKAMQLARRSGIEPLLYPSAGSRPVLNASSSVGTGTDGLFSYRIVGIDYRFPNRSAKSARGKRKSDKDASLLQCLRVAAVLQLRPEGDMRAKNASVETVDTNDVSLTYFPVDDLPEYLVLSSRVRAAATESWKSGDRFRILFLSERREWQYYDGLVRRVKPKVQSSPWNAIEVQYDNEGDPENGNVDFVSPWELERASVQDDAKGGGLVRSNSKSVANASDAELWHAIRSNIEGLIARDKDFRRHMSWFMAPVESLAAISKYCDVVPCPLDFEIVTSRLSSGYYRSFDAFVQDMFLIRSNAILFNSPNSDIAECASLVYSKVIDIAEKTRAALAGPQNSMSGTASAHGFGGNGATGPSLGSAVASTRGAFAPPSIHNGPRLSPPPGVFAVPAGVRETMAGMNGRHALPRTPAMIGNHSSGPSVVQQGLYPNGTANLGPSQAVVGSAMPQQVHGMANGRSTQELNSAHMRPFQHQRPNLLQQQTLQQDYPQVPHRRAPPLPAHRPEDIFQSRLGITGSAMHVGVGGPQWNSMVPIASGAPQCHQSSSRFAGYSTSAAASLLPHQSASRLHGRDNQSGPFVVTGSPLAAQPVPTWPAVDLASSYGLRRRAATPASNTGVNVVTGMDHAGPATRNSTLHSRGAATQGRGGTTNIEIHPGRVRNTPSNAAASPLPFESGQDCSRNALDPRRPGLVDVQRRPIETRASAAKAASGTPKQQPTAAVSSDIRYDASTGAQGTNMNSGFVPGASAPSNLASGSAGGRRLVAESGTQSCAGSTEAAGGMHVHATTSESRFMTSRLREQQPRSPSPQSRTANVPASSPLPRPSLEVVTGANGNAFANVATTSPASATPALATPVVPALAVPPREHSSISIFAAESATCEAPRDGKGSSHIDTADREGGGGP